MTEKLTPAAVEEMIRTRPFHEWLGLRVQKVDESGIELTATWREEWVANPERRYTHGGILATLVDLAADWALVMHTGRGVPTIDMRVDYHRAAMPGDLTAKGRIVKLGSQFSVAEASVHDKDGALLASGRGVYLTASPKA
ncbi:PaaI family thioesterase [Bradyrhizobium sp. NP1]|uniref:PaaI family thioesterase n=1 Tax=Bradyrhizobium sp. NP1 TaxID=3049772 RepID=UPI0025A504BC|nr:PaaI family thioesterase [Bradyrhizobium sp. NP1]WJR80994.1 PaaI family thioesterase [Bradyrhizobium sp. NP1]